MKIKAFVYKKMKLCNFVEITFKPILISNSDIQFIMTKFQHVRNYLLTADIMVIYYNRSKNFQKHPESLALILKGAYLCREF